MRITTNLALYPAADRRRSAWLLLLSLLFAAAVTATHLLWVYSAAEPAARIRGEAELLAREASVLQTRLEGLEQALDPDVVRELSDRVVAANELIVRGAVDPVGLLAVLEASTPRSLVMERLSLSSSNDGVRAELTLRAENQAEAMQLVADLRAIPSIRDITPVSEQATEGGDQIVLSLLYRPAGLERR